MTDVADGPAGGAATEEPEVVWDAVLPKPTDDDALDRVAASRPGGLAVAPEALPYELEERPEPPPVPNGWYALCRSSDVAPGADGTAGPLTVIAFGREVVVFRDGDGAARVVGAYCPHMGAHLGGGEVRGGRLACPYHGWRYDGSGRCVEIPYGEGRIPSRACVRSYEVREVNGMVLAWYHAADAAPTYEVPAVEEVDDPAFTDAIVYRAELVASLQDMAENNVDCTHFFFVHGRAALDESTSRFRTDGPLSTVVERFEDQDLEFRRWTYGPGIALLRVTDLMTILTATTPIDRRHVRLLWHFHLPLAMEPLADSIVEGVTGAHGLHADVPIWRDKVFVRRPLLVKGDGPISEFRRWYSQFYEGNPGWAP